MGNFSTKSSVEEIIFVATVCKKESQKISMATATTSVYQHGVLSVVVFLLTHPATAFHRGVIL
jgi:hypothetical protein